MTGQREAYWDGRDLSLIQMLRATRINGVPAVTVDQGTWDLRVRGHEGVVPPETAIIRETGDGELEVIPIEDILLDGLRNS